MPVQELQPHGDPSSGLDAFQDCDTVGISRSVCKWNCMVTSIAELPRRINEAFEIATSGRPGPALIDLPKDITAGILRKAIPTQNCLPSFPSIASQAAKRLMEKQLNTSLGHAAGLIKVAKQPIIYAGQGIIQSKGGTELLRELADKCSIPVTTTLQGLGAFDERDEKSLHMLGIHGIAYANMSMQEAGLIIALGARFDDRVVLNASKFAPNAKAAAAKKRGGIIYFDILPKNINKVIQATEAIEGDIATNLKMLIPMLTSISVEQRSEWFNKISEWKANWPLSNYERADSPGGNDLIKPQSVIEELSDLTSKIEAQHYTWREPRSFVTSGGLGTMGFGLPSAIGIAVARPDALVIDIDGDASFNMTLAELSTAAQFNIGVEVIVLINEEQGMVTQWQNLFYEDRYAHTHQRNPNFVKLADAMDGPALLEVVTDKKVPVLPMVPAGAGVHEFLVYDREKDKARRQLMRERTSRLYGEEGFNIDGQTPLWLNAAKGHEAIVRLLIKEGADIHIKDKHGRTPLLLAAMKGHEAILQLLLNKGADTRMSAVRELLDKGADTEAADSYRTPLMLAARGDNASIVQLLLENGADIMAKDSKHNQTPLSRAADRGHEAVVRLLLEKDADLEAES
ncbi:hypothetical protein H633G_04227 [Metarhizium anisopliae BRIP 53284]|nr:hypothetical protein H633G_04227 [Metarhizium anisopliae BRIP 53284]